MKSIKKFKEICKASDFLITRYKSYSFIRILPELHVLREHPEDIKKYDLVEKKLTMNFFYTFFNLLFKYFFSAFKNLLNKKSNWFIVKKLRYKTYNNIFISHLIHVNQFNSGNIEDLYFNNMPVISSKKCKTLVVLINNKNINIDKILLKPPKANYDIVILSDNLLIKDKIYLFFCSFSVLKNLLYEIIFKLKNLEKYLLLNAFANIFSRNTQFTYRIYFQVKKLVDNYKPNNMFFTYEGYAWEKGLCLSIKEESSSTQAIGYQHSRLFKYQYSIKRAFNNQLDPDIILTSGKYSYNELKKLLKNIKVINIGKFQKKYNNFNNVKNIKSSNIYICVLPEAFIEECLKLLKFSYNCAIKYKDLVFIWRFHPETNLKKLFSEFKFKNTHHKNIIISNKPLREDLIKSNMVLYRGSTSIIPAMKSGLFPIYYKIFNEFDIDVVEENCAWRIKTSNPLDMHRKIKKFLSSKSKLLKLQKESKKFSNNYFSNFEEKKFINLFCK